MKTIWICIISFLAVNAFAQNIPLKGNLGVKLSKARDNTHGAIYAVAEVTPNSTAENLGLKADDILVSINGEILDSNQKIPEVIGKFIAGEQAKANILRNGKLLSLTGTIVAPPPLKKPNHELQLLEVPFRDGFTRAYLTHPKGEGPFPTIYYIQGYPCQSINNHPQSPVLQLTSGLVDLGYAVFRIEKLGVGEYSNLSPCMEYSFDDEVENFKNGLDFLHKSPSVDTENIFIFGHSLGGNVASIIAQEENLAGVMTFGTLIKPWDDCLLDMAYYSQTQAQNALEVKNQIDVLKSALSKLYIENASHNTLNNDEKELLSQWHDYKPDGTVFNRKIEFWQNFNQHNYFEEWAKVKVPVLAMYGESDAHAISPLDTELISTIVNQHHEGNGTFMLVENTNHLFANVPTKAKELEYINNGLATQVAFTQFNQKLPNIIDEWIGSEKNKMATQLFQRADLQFPKEQTKMSSMDVVAQDVNNDGFHDLIIATEFGPNRLFLFESDRWVDQALPQLKEYSAPYFGEDSEDIAAADFDNDGDIDLFFVSEDTPNHELLLNDGKGNYTFSSFQIAKKGDANAVLVYDFNNDGWKDILIGIRGQNEVYINLKGKGFKENTDKYWVNNSDYTQDLISVDIDNDGDLDIVEGIEQGGNNLFINEKGKFYEKSELLPLPNAIETRKVIAHDFDKDGDQDLFFCNVGWNPSMNPQNQLLLNEGKGQFKNVTDWLPKDSATTLDGVFQDLNDDGLTDLITTNFVNDTKVKIYLGKKDANSYAFQESENLIPSLNFYGGTSVLSLEAGGVDYLYFANFKSGDALLKKK